VTSVLDRALVALDPFLVTWPLNVALDEAEADDCPKCILSPATDTLDDALTEDWALRVTNPLRVTLDAIPIDADDSLTLVASAETADRPLIKTEPSSRSAVEYAALPYL
jgi:hypothetical protein